MSELHFPKIMGILNVTPDSFSDGGNFFDESAAIDKALKLIDDGADIIDIGGESTRPGAESVAIQEEIERVIPVISGIRDHNKDIRISIDTSKYEVARLAIGEGASIINDISGLRNDERIVDLAAEYNSALVIMHMLGSPRTMQIDPKYDDVLTDIYDFLDSKVKLAKQSGVKEIYADVGIGFGKTVEHNLILLKNLDHFSGLGVPLLIGISRKSFIGKAFGIDDPANRDVPTALFHALTLSKEVEIIRVHNVEMLKMLKDIFYLLK
jgi:dihydropteroate synthase